MGNSNTVHASSANGKNDFGLFTPPGSMPEKKEDVKLENPGLLEEIHKKTKEVFPVVFDGARVILNKTLSNHFQVSHTLIFNTQQPGAYRFGATFVGANQFGPGEAYPVLIGDVDAKGQLNANIIHQINQRTRLKFQAQMSNRNFQVAQIQGDYRGDNFTCSGIAINPDPLNGVQGIYVGQYLQSITPRLALGAEFAWQRMAQIPGGQISNLSFSGKYTGNDYVCSGTIGSAVLHLCYYQKASEQLHFGVEMETSLRNQEAVGTFGYMADLSKIDLQFRGSVDTNWNVSASLEKKLLPMPFTLSLSGILNHTKSNFRLGLGFMIG